MDASGNVLDAHAADSFGGVLDSPVGAGSSDPYAGYGAQWGYYRDAETGLYLCTLRYYDPVDGRWLTADPGGYAGGANLYNHCTNNPVNDQDPSGLSPAVGGGVSDTIIGQINGTIPVAGAGGVTRTAREAALRVEAQERLRRRSHDRAATVRAEVSKALEPPPEPRETPSQNSLKANWMRS